jgi:hypothetical protein
VGTFHDPSDGAEHLPVWAYLHINNKGRTPVTMELGSHMDLGGDDEMNWEIYYENIGQDDINGDEPVHLCAPFNAERCRSDLVALVKYYFLLAADAGLFENRDIVFNESFGQTMRAICRRVRKLAIDGVRRRTSSLFEFPKRPLQFELETDTSDLDTDEDAISELSVDSSSSSENDYEARPQRGSRRVKPRSLRLNGKYNASEHEGQQESCFNSDFQQLWDRGGIIPLERLKNGLTKTSEPTQPTLSAAPRRAECSRIPNLEDLRERNETLSSEIDSLRVDLATKEAKKRKLDLELYELLSRKSRKCMGSRSLGH